MDFGEDYFNDKKGKNMKESAFSGENGDFKSYFQSRVPTTKNIEIKHLLACTQSSDLKLDIDEEKLGFNQVF